MMIVDHFLLSAIEDKVEFLWSRKRVRGQQTMKIGEQVTERIELQHADHTSAFNKNQKIHGLF